MFCRKCGIENPDNATFCKSCGSEFIEKKEYADLITKPKEVEIRDSEDKSGDKPPETGEDTSQSKIKNKIFNLKFLVPVGVIALILIAAVGLMFAFINVDVAMDVNYAFFTDYVGGNNTTDGKFLVMNVSVENRGNSPVTISGSDFKIGLNNSTSNASFYTGNTDIPDKKELKPGEKSSILLIFKIGNQSSESRSNTGNSYTLSYNSFWDPLTPQKNSSFSVHDLPFNNAYISYDVDGVMTAGGQTKNFKQKKEIRYNNNTGFIDGVKTISMVSPSSPRFEFSNVIVTLKVGNFNESFFSEFFYDDIFSNNPEKSEKIDIMGKKIDCWVVKGSTIISSTNSNQEYTRYYDKTTGLLLKEVLTETNSQFGVKTTFTTTLSSTNIPLIGIKQ